MKENININKHILSLRNRNPDHFPVSNHFNPSVKMVKLSTVTLAVVSALPSLTLAAKCTNGLFYCGYNLKKKGTFFLSFIPCRELR